MMKKLTILLLPLLVGCQKDDNQLAHEIARGAIAACPVVKPDDEQARVDCAAKLTDLKAMKEAQAEGMLWGGQKPGRGYRLDKFTTRFNTLVWRKMYMSLFMFEPNYKVEQIAGSTVIHLPYRFRYALDIGSYPYPFWHSQGKWDSWNYSKELILVLKDGKITGALRSADWDMTRPMIAHPWNGQWVWQNAAQNMPFVSFYGFLFNPANPHVSRLDDAYRALEAEMRPQYCQVCHSPDNRADVDQLEFFNYPNQALYSRHGIVDQLMQNKMPPENDAGIPVGIVDDAARQRLIQLARNFAAAGDEALAWEGELKASMRAPDMAVK